MNFLSDKEINLNETDHLNTKLYVELLQNIIVNPSQQESITIGLFGAWGSGKSSIISTLEFNVSRMKSPKIKIVVYDAWKYVNDSFRRMFLLKLCDELQYDKQEKFKSFYTNQNSDDKIIRRPNYIRSPQSFSSQPGALAELCGRRGELLLV